MEQDIISFICSNTLHMEIFHLVHQMMECYVATLESNYSVYKSKRRSRGDELQKIERKRAH